MKRKEVIQQAAAELFSRNGYKDTSIAALSRLTGIAEGTIFHHFKNKEALFLSVLKDVHDRILSQFRQFNEHADSDNGLEAVIAGVSFYLQLAGELEDQFLMIHRHYTYQIAASNPECRQYLESVYNCVLAFFESAIADGQQDGSIRDMPPRKAALLIFGLVDGVVRLHTYRLYQAGTLYTELLDTCRRVLT